MIKAGDSGTEVAAVRTVAGNYLDGMVYADEKKLRSAFHPRAAVVGRGPGGLEWDSVDAFVAAVLRDGGPQTGTSYFAEIISVDITGDLAMVKLTDDYLGARYTDYLTMMCNDGRWTIIHKAFHQHGAHGRSAEA